MMHLPWSNPMLNAEWLYESCFAAGIDFFTGVPDSVLKEFCACLADRSEKGRHIVAANEGGAIALAAGYHLATGGMGMAYMQNAGLGNGVNPLLSLADREVYAIPMLLLIGWRGEPGTRDEPQHMKQGRVTPGLLECMGIPWWKVGATTGEAAAALAKAVEAMKTDPGPVALLASNNSFERYLANKPVAASSRPLGREEAIGIVVETLPEAAIVGTTGMISRELHEVRARRGAGTGADFLNVGAMGHASQIAAAIAAFRPARKIVCLDGDGAGVMHLGGLATISRILPGNFVHVVLNNQAHDSVGGQETTNPGLAFAAVAGSMGYADAVRVENGDALKRALLSDNNGPIMIEVMVRKGARKELGRPGNDLAGFKEAFKKCLAGVV